jgi:hypothetical protein
VKIAAWVGGGLVAAFVAMTVALAAAFSASAPAAGSCGQPLLPTSPVSAHKGKLTQTQISKLWIASGGSTASINISGVGPVPNPVIAGAVGMAESGGDPTIVNGIGASGLMQIHPPEPGDLDPAVNMKIAVRKWKAARGWSPWEAFTGADAIGDDGPWRTYLHGAKNVAGTLPVAAPCAALPGGSQTLPSGGPWLANLPGMPGIQCDARIVPDVEALIRRYHIRVSACYAPTGHEAGGEHPLGLATDIEPGTGGTWDDVDRLARDVGWVRPCGPSGVRPACPLKPWLRFVGYDGYANHGRGNHLHLSWMHGAGRPAATVVVFPTSG